jgi:hypothetical protein
MGAWYRDILAYMRNPTVEKRAAMYFALIPFVLLLGGCTLLNQEDLPEKDWTVTSAEYWVNVVPPRDFIWILT